MVLITGGELYFSSNSLHETSDIININRIKNIISKLNIDIDDSMRIVGQQNLEASISSSEALSCLPHGFLKISGAQLKIFHQLIMFPKLKN